MGEYMTKLSVDGVIYCYGKVEDGVLLYDEDRNFLGKFDAVSAAVDYLIGGHRMRRASDDMQSKLMQNLQALQGEMSGPDFAKKIGLNRSSYYQYVTGGRFPSAAALEKIADACGVTIGWLLGKE